MKGRSWKLVGVIVGVAVLAVLLGLTVHLVRSTSVANRDLAALRNEVAQQQRESAAKQTALVAPIAARIDDLSNKVKQQADTIADVSDLGDRVSKLEEEAQDAARPPAVTPSPATPSAVSPAAEAVPQKPVESSPAATQPPVAPVASVAEPAQPAALVPAEAAVQTPPAVALRPEEPAVPAEVTPQGEPIETGRFVILQAGVQIGVEDFELADTDTGYVLSSTLRESDGLDGTQLAQTAMLDKGFLPTRYEIRGTKDGIGRNVAAEVVDGQAIATSLGGRILQTQVQSASLVAAVDPAFPSCCVVIQRSLAASLGGQPGEWSVFSGEATAFVPLRLAPAAQVTVSDTTNEDVGYAYEMTFSGETIQYYVHGDRVVGFSIPSRELFAYRSDMYPKGLRVFPRTVMELGMPTGVREQDFTLGNQGFKLIGTFAAPSSASAKMPALLLLPDIGLYDRGGGKVGLEAQTLRDIARRFAQQGIASYRFDPRGIGASEGNYASVSLANVESDALIALVWLRANPMIDPDKIYVVGYGYGGIVALHLAASGMAHGVATLAMPASSFGVNAMEVLRNRAGADGLSGAEMDALADRERSFFEYVRGTTGTWTDSDLAKVQASLPWMDEVEYAKRTSEVPLPLLRSLVDLNPLDAVRAAKGRLFVLEGTKDFDVPASDADLLAQAAKDGGNQDVTTAVVQDVNHLLRAHLEDAASLDRHVDEEVSWNVLQPLLNWMGGPVIPAGGSGGPAPAS